MHALISIHDVMPHTLDRVMNILEHLAHLESRHIALLVVPGLKWTAPRLDSLRQLETRGFVLAGHGWHHRARRIKGPYHRLHAALLSRNAAEHLALNEQEIHDLINDCFNWFESKGFIPPDLYVPPAWAMGKISKDRLRDTPFRYFETTAGLYNSREDRQTSLPLTGFQADNLFRSVSLRLWNGLNKMMATEKRPVRLSIHPDDLQLHLKDALLRDIDKVTTAADYRSIC